MEIEKRFTPLLFYTPCAGLIAVLISKLSYYVTTQREVQIKSNAAISRSFLKGPGYFMWTSEIKSQLSFHKPITIWQ